MKEKNSNLVVIFTALMGMVLMAGVRAEGPEPKVARMQVFDNFVGWEEVAHFQSVNLRISGPDGMYFEETFNQGDSIYFDLTTISAPDGTYHWELRAAPILSEGVRDWLAYAGETGDEEVLKELHRSGHLPDRASVDSGAFTVVDGTVVNPDIAGTEKGMASPGYSFRSPSDLSPADFVHTDDVIIPANACVGFDCTAGEGFGFDTLRLKETVLRIDFTDTSNTYTFPTQDWTLVANDTFDGGANYFAIRADSEDGTTSTTPFKIEAGAPTNSLYVDDDGRIGIGTSVPGGFPDIHIVDPTWSAVRLEAAYSGQAFEVANISGVFAVYDETNAVFPIIAMPNAGNFIYLEGDTNHIGMGTEYPDTPLNIQTGADMVTPQPDTVLHLENDEQDGFGTDLTITAAVDKSSRIHFAKPGDPDAGRLYYSNATDNFTFVAAGATRMQLGPGVGTLPEVEVFGDLSITGSLSKGGGGFKIDHPLEPEKKYLSHSFVESPDMMNVYNGKIELNKEGEAWVQLPDYFEALNRDFLYQLTPIGAPAPSVFVAETISDNRFKIAGGPAGVLIFWQVTGVRKDTWAEANRIQVEESKSRN